MAQGDDSLSGGADLVSVLVDCFDSTLLKSFASFLKDTRLVLFLCLCLDLVSR